MNNKYDTGETLVGKSMKTMNEDEIRQLYEAPNPNTRSAIASAVLSFVGSYLGSAAFKCGSQNKN